MSDDINGAQDLGESVNAGQSADASAGVQQETSAAPAAPATPVAAPASSGTIKRKHHHSHRDPSEGGWDTSVVAAPYSHTNEAHKHKHRRKHRRKWVKPLVIVLIVIAVLAAAAFGLYMWYMNSINEAMKLDEATKAEVEEALVEAEADQAFYVLVMGSDLRQTVAEAEAEAEYYADSDTYGVDGISRSDALFVVRVDPATSTVTVLSMPRDTPYTYPDGTIGKLNHVYTSYGASGVINAVQKITGLNISHYVELRGSDLENLVNNLGGISVEVPMTFDYTTITGEYVHLDEGLQHIDGAQALALAGMRVLYEGKSRDILRQSAGREVIRGIMDAVLSRPLLELPGTIADAAACMKTDMTADEILDIAQKMNGSPTIYQGAGPMEGSVNPYVYDDKYDGGHPWLCYVDDEGWERVVSVMEENGDPGEVSYEGDLVHYAGQPRETWMLGLVTPDELEEYEAELENAA